MESLLKYLRGGAVAGSQRAAATTIAASACGEAEDDASFFDLEFAVPGDETDAEEERVEFNFAVAAGEEPEVVAAADDNGAVVGAGGEEESGKKKKDDDNNSAAATEEETKESEEGVEVAAPPPNSAASSLPPRAAAAASTKFRVLLLKLRKPNTNNKAAAPAAEGTGATAAAPKTNRFLIKFRVDSEAPALLTRENSSRTSDAGADCRAPAAGQQAMTSEERRLVKEVVLKYLSKIKPLYVKVSRLRFAGGDESAETDAEPEPPSPSATAPSPAPHPVVVACGVRAPRASVPAGLKQVCKRLGKSRSASAAVAAAPPPTSAPSPVAVPSGMQRRDDSLLQVQDGIQSAIAHCKRSFNAASKGSVRFGWPSHE